MPTANPSSDGVSRFEWTWLGAAILFGAMLRLVFLNRIAIEHFDEAVYASNFWFGEESGYEYPFRYLYAPPLLPMAIEWVMIAASLFGIRPTGFIPAIPVLVAGMATIPSMWWIARKWFGPSAALVAAWLVAASDFHASYSRTALTDVPVCLFMLWAVYFAANGLQSGLFRDLLISGLFTGLAWSTKYSGWLPLAIALAGGVAWQLTIAKSDRQIRRSAFNWLTIAVTAFVVWTPVLYGLQKHGGYAAVMANHRHYGVGFAGWPASAIRQLTIAGVYDDWLGVPGEIALFAVTQSNDPGAGSEAVQAIDLLISKQTEESGGNLSVSSPAQMSFVGQFVVMSTPVLFLLGSLAGCVCWIARRRRTSNTLPGWLVVAWICGLSASIPLYHPYPRLILPWLIPVWIGFGLGVDSLNYAVLSRLRAIEAEANHASPGWLQISLVGWIVVATLIRCVMGIEHAWQDRTNLARQIETEAGKMKWVTREAGFPRNETIAYVYGEPAVVFGLKGSELPLVGPVPDFQFLEQPQQRPTFFIFSERANRSSEFLEQHARHQNRLHPFASSSVQWSHIVVFDENDPYPALSRRLKRPDSLWIERVEHE